MTVKNLLKALLICLSSAHGMTQTTPAPQAPSAFFSSLAFKSGSDVGVTDTAQLDVSISNTYPASLQNAKLPPGVTLPASYKQTKTSSTIQRILLQDFNNPAAPKLTVQSIATTDGEGPAAKGAAISQAAPGGQGTPQVASAPTSLSIDCATVPASHQDGEPEELGGQRSDCAIFENSVSTATFLNSLSTDVGTVVPPGVAVRLLPLAVSSLTVSNWTITLTKTDGGKAIFSLEGATSGKNDSSFAKFSGTCVVDQLGATVTVHLTSTSQTSQTLPDSSIVTSAGTLTIDASRQVTIT
jgi:hypothetical protein